MPGESAISSILVLGHSGEWWDSALIIALVATAFAAVAVVGTTAGSVIAHKREAASADAALAHYKLETAGKVAEATTAGVAAGERASQALATADTARADTARFQKEAAEANLKAEQIKAQLAWRQLDPAQSHALLEAASAAPGAVNIRYTDGDPEALAFAQQFADLFRRAGWPVGLGARKSGNRLLFGVFIGVTAENSRLPAVLVAAKLSVAPLPTDSLISESNVSTVREGTILMIGSKPRPT